MNSILAYLKERVTNLTFKLVPKSKSKCHLMGGKYIGAGLGGR